ncbi:hypothetical protein [Caulobacter sp. RHG1]|nr:hypothetical protein [Caulobacter sp. RHG1]NQE65218.1 hypothetical protein [Caulobacter sp. RHG1]
MAAKAFFTVALLIAAAVGLALPTPGATHQKPQATQSSFETLALNKG